MSIVQRLIVVGLMTPSALTAQSVPIIDMHLHAYLADAQGPPPTVVCAV